LFYSPEQQFSTSVPQHSGVMQRVHRCAMQVWGKVKKKQEKLMNKKVVKHLIN
jgi:hypothetical protein